MLILTFSHDAPGQRQIEIVVARLITFCNHDFIMSGAVSSVGKFLGFGGGPSASAPPPTPTPQNSNAQEEEAEENAQPAEGSAADMLTGLGGASTPIKSSRQTLLGN